MKSNKEKTFTSTDEKLLAGGLDRIVEFQKTGLLLPQSLQLAPEDRCQMDCTWCSTKYREHEYTQVPEDSSKVVIGQKKKDANHIPFSQIDEVVGNLSKFGTLKTVEVTGGGDPSMYRDRKTGETISDVIDLLKDKYHLQIGMITNGMGLTKLVRQEALDKLTWLRCSLASFDPQNFHGNNDGHEAVKYTNKFPDLPAKINGKLGFSYVWGPFSDVKVLEKIADYAKSHQVDFVRVVPDCLDVQKQGEFKGRVGELIDFYNQKIGKETLFFQSKSYSVYPTCRIGFIKPFLNADGHFYHCSAVPLYNQAFTPHWRMGHLSEVDKIWKPENVGKFDTSKCETGKCFYSEQNSLLDSVSKERQGIHRDFI